uniref:Uncharacterized protein n=1 Tax=viral metagenome TaxID=1070528 RepID=A0A6M3IHM9_9ZZZZ
MGNFFGPFKPGASIRLKIECRHWDMGTLSDPSTSQTITLDDSEGGSILADAALTKASTGKYHRVYTTSGASHQGTWKGHFEMTSGSEVAQAFFAFELGNYAEDGGLFKKGDSVRLKVFVWDEDTNEPSDPATSQKVYLYGPEGTLVLNGQALTKEAAGEYFFAYATTASSHAGKWTGYFELNDSAEITMVPFYFQLED